MLEGGGWGPAVRLGNRRGKPGGNGPAVACCGAGVSVGIISGPRACLSSPSYSGDILLLLIELAVFVLRSFRGWLSPSSNYGKLNHSYSLLLLAQVQGDVVAFLLLQAVPPLRTTQPWR